THFQDDTFPPNDSSIWKSRLNLSKSTHQPIEWKRCKLSKNPHLFILDNGKLNTDVLNNNINSSWLVSALGVLAAHPNLLHKVVPNWIDQDWCHSDEPGKQLGVYNFRDTERHPVVVDDYLPTRNNHLIFSRSKNPNEMWCSLLEKAYAKLCKCYEALEAGSASDALVDLTGTVPETIELKSDIDDDCHDDVLKQMGDKKFIAMLQLANNTGALMSCSINALEGERKQERLPNGLVIGHVYGITGMANIKPSIFKRNKEIVLIKLHNPWGEVEWNGRWSDNSSEWQKISISKRNKLGFKIAEDGDFWMSFEDFTKNFSTLVICRHLNTSWFTLGKRWYGTILHGRWSIKNKTAGGCINNINTFYENPQYSILVHKPTTLVVALMQKDNDKKVTIGFICLKIEENRKYRIHKSTYETVGSVTYKNVREVTTRMTLNSGHYVLIPSTFNNGKEASYFLRIFSTRPIKIRQLIKDVPPKKWYDPIIYFGKSYYVGMVRIQIIKGDFKREVNKGYVRLSFFDLKSRVSKCYETRHFKKSYDPEIKTEYIFYVRDPQTAGFLLQLYQSRAFKKDEMLGEMRLGIDNYSKMDKIGKTWEVTKTLTKVVRLPNPIGIFTSQEVEATQEAKNTNQQINSVNDYNNYKSQSQNNKKYMIGGFPVSKKNNEVIGGENILIPQVVDSGI
ncbi:162_t:CDS:2, partial [Entrophospora sp. SA101]